MNARRLTHAVFCLTLIALAFGIQPALPVQGQYPDESQPAPSFASLLQPDGSLQIPPGLTGSFDVEGWRMALDEHGQPHFYQSQDKPSADLPDDRLWSHDFMLGVETIGFENDSYVFAIAIMGGVKVFVGGDFSAAGGVPANNIACWDSSLGRWEALGSGVNSRVRAIAVHGSYVYVGGNFTRAGGISTGQLARWDTNTQTWSAIGTLAQDTISPSVSAIEASVSGEVYVGGNFKSVNGIIVNNIARLAGDGWHALSSGITSGSPTTTRVNAIYLDVYGTLYVGGTFTTAGGYGASNLALWDGISWHPVGGGVGGINATVNAIAEDAGKFVAGGNFSEAYDGHGGTLPVSNIAMWDGATWSDMGGGVNSDVYAFRELGTGLHVAGRFSTAGGAPARNLAVWLLNSWHTVKDPDEANDGTDGNIYAIESFSDYLVIGGGFEHAGDHVAHHVAALNWDLTRWVAMGNSVNSTIYAVAIGGGYVYVGGTFTTATNRFQAYLARWHIDHNNWYIVGTGSAITGCTGILCKPVVRAIAIRGDDIYIGGNFTTIGSLTVNGIARFNYGAEYGWHALGSGLSCSPFPCSITVRDIAVSGSNVYIGGSFDAAGGVAASNVALWNGSSWSPLADFDYNGTNGIVYALALRVNGLVVGGNFSQPEIHIALWNGANWAPIGNGSFELNGPVYAMAGGGFLTPLYIGGAFTNPSHVAVLHGNTWDPLDAGLDDVVRALALDGEGGVYAGGDFNYSSLLTVPYVAHWDGDDWLPMGSGVNAPVHALAVTGKRLAAGGEFTRAGNYPSYFLASWSKVPLFLPDIQKH